MAGSLERRRLARLTSDIHVLMLRTAENFIRIGQKLNEVKQMLNHGEWRAWLQREFQASERTAQRYMALARRAESMQAYTIDSLEALESPAKIVTALTIKTVTMADLVRSDQRALPAPVADPAPAAPQLPKFFDDVPVEAFAWPPPAPPQIPEPTYTVTATAHEWTLVIAAAREFLDYEEDVERHDPLPREPLWPTEVREAFAVILEAFCAHLQAQGFPGDAEAPRDS
jgi:hypothetical protein